MSSNSPSPYQRFVEDDLTLRDLLAVDRTVVANERTLLGYIRTTLALVLSGGSMVKFLDDPYLQMLGWLFLGCGVPVMVVGLWRYRRRHAALAPLMRRQHSG